MYERFTDRARKVMQLASQEAQRFNHEYIGTEHILLGLVKEGAGVAANVLKNLDIDLRKIRLEVEKIVQRGPDILMTGRLPQTPRAKKVIEYSIEEARSLSHNYVGTEHLLLGLVREDQGVASQVLMNLGLSLEAVRVEVLNILGHTPDRASATPAAAHKTPALDSFGTDLTALARDGRLEPCVGRANELDCLLLVLGCRGDRNALLVGPPGVGKSALMRGLAHLAVGDNPPEVLCGRRVVRVRLAATATDVKLDPGRMLERIQALTDEVRRAGNVLPFVEDLFAFNFSRLYKGVLDVAGVLWVAAASPETYEGLCKSETQGRNWQPVFVSPPSGEEVIAILHAHRAALQVFHRAPIADDALGAAAALSERHITEGSQPSKALRLLDQAAALYRLRNAPAQPDTRELDLQIEELNQAKEQAIAEQDFERAALKRDQAAKLVREKERRLTSWNSERQIVGGLVDAGTVEQAVTKLTGVQFRGSEAIRPKIDPV